ncbi:MAG: hypothetical protein Q8K75_01925 [Chlamydiales bacterium]|nr:hypothetical protein [Chlamydiales bacterium]
MNIVPNDHGINKNVNQPDSDHKLELSDVKKTKRQRVAGFFKGLLGSVFHRNVKAHKSEEVKGARKSVVKEKENLPAVQKGASEDVHVIGANILVGRPMPEKLPDSHRMLADQLGLQPPLSDAQLQCAWDHIHDAARIMSGDEQPEKTKKISDKLLSGQIALREQHSLLLDLVSPGQAARLTNQRDIPVIKEGFQVVRSELEFTALSKGGMDGFRLKPLVENLNKISEAVDGLQGRDRQVFAGVSMSDFPQDYKSKLQDYMSGAKVMDDRAVVEFKQKMAVVISQSTPSPAVVPDLSKRPRINPDAIAGQAGLQGVKREGKEWLLKQPSEVANEGKSANLVKKIYNANNELIGFYKTGKKDDVSTALAEHLMYDAAVAMGLEKSFAPTGRMNLISGADISKTNAGTEVSIIDGDGNLQKVKLNTHALDRPKGSIQVAQSGTTLREALDASQELPIKNVVPACTTQIAMGMFDAHWANVLVDENSQLKFFDNASSLPQSNTPMLWGRSFLRLPFRSGLLASPTMYQDLSPTDRAQLKGEVAVWKERLASFKQFASSPSSESRMQALPPGWWDTKKIVSSMEQRIAAMEKAVNNPKVKNLRDFTLECYPDLKFYAAIHMTQQGSNFSRDRQMHSDGLSRLGFGKVDQLIKGAAELGLDIEEIRGWCDDPNLDFDEIMVKVESAYNKADAKYMDALKNDLDYDIEPQLQKAQRLISTLRSNAVTELKDIPTKESKEIQLSTGMDLLRELNIPRVQGFDSRPNGFSCSVQWVGEEQEIWLYELKPGQQPAQAKAMKVDLSKAFDDQVGIKDDQGKFVNIKELMKR